MKMKLMTAVLALAVVLPAARVAADNDIDLPINGDFRGSPAGYSPAPGWTLTADGGNARILPTTDRDDFILELRAAPTRSQSVLSNPHQIPGNVLKLELKLSGTGNASVGYEALDGTGTTIIAADRLTMALAGYDQKVKHYFTLPQQARFVRIRLTAEAGAVAQFRDVDADISVTTVATAPAAAGAIAAPAPTATAAPTPGAIAAPAPVAPAQAAPAPAPAAAPTPPPAARLLQNDKYYAYSFLGQDEHFTASLPVGSDIDFKLGEDAGSGRYWQVTSYDPAICRVKLEHDQDGVFPIRWDKAEIELKAMMRGSTVVVFVCGEKRFTVHFTAL